MKRLRLAALCVLFLLPASNAHADWLITPFIGSAFAGETTFLLLERGGGTSTLTVGAAVALLTDGLLGLEAEVGHTPGFFEGDDRAGLIVTSRVTTLSGSVMVAAPVALTRESLRPYLVGGLGLLQARTTLVGRLLPGVEQDLLGLTLGGGAIGMLSERAGLRFDLRHVKAVSGADGPLAREGTSRLSFWRATAGVVVRY
jgi:hypothetical protein